MANLTRKMQRARKLDKSRYVIAEMGRGDITLGAAECERMVEQATEIADRFGSMSAEERCDFTVDVITDTECPIIVGVYPDPEVERAFRFHIIKGAHLIAGSANNDIDVSTIAFPCANLKDAQEIALHLGDGRNEGTVQ
jgi:hypothetical protein